MKKASINSYRDLVVWQKAMELVTMIYTYTNSFPEREIYGLTNQMRRAAVSIPSNIAEGYGRNMTADYVRFLKIATGSLYEIQTQAEISVNLKYLGQSSLEKIFSCSNQIERMLNTMVKRITA